MRVGDGFSGPSSAFPSSLSPALLLRACVRTRRASTTHPALVAPLPSRFLLEFLDFALHEPASLRFLAVAERVMTAVRAALPTFGISFLAGRTEDAFR
jgi:hypothetical protein